MNSIDPIRFRGLCSALAAALCFGLAHPVSAGSQPLWVRQLGTSQNDLAQGVATDRYGNVYIIGSTQGSLGGSNRGGLDAWIMKYTATGALLWKQQPGTSRSDAAYGVATDAHGNVYISGYNRSNQGGSDAFLIKYSAAGALLWKRQLGSSDWHWYIAYGVATDGEDNVYIDGSTEVHPEDEPPFPLGDAWVAKYSSTGTMIWKRTIYSHPSDRFMSAFASGVAADRHGNSYICGQVYAYDAPYDSNAWVAKYSPAGAVLWRRTFGSSEWDGAFGLATDDGGNIYIAGQTNGALAGPNRGESDAWVAKISAVGASLWRRQLGTPSADEASGAATDDKGAVYIVGSTWGSLGGPNLGSGDAFLAKHSQHR